MGGHESSSVSPSGFKIQSAPKTLTDVGFGGDRGANTLGATVGSVLSSGSQGAAGAGIRRD